MAAQRVLGSPRNSGPGPMNIRGDRSYGRRDAPRGIPKPTPTRRRRATTLCVERCDEKSLIKIRPNSLQASNMAHSGALE